MVASSVLGLLPLLALRTWATLQIYPTANALNLRRMTLGELEAWCIVAAVGALLLRHAGRARPVVRVGFHIFTTVLLGVSTVELVFTAVTGGRVDLEVLGFFFADLEQIAPVFLSEVKLPHLIGLIVASALALSPALLRTSRIPAWVGRLWIVPVIVVAMIEGGGRLSPRREIKMLQPSLLELLFWDALERAGDVTIKPDPASLEPLVVTRERPFTPKYPHLGSALPNIVFIVLESTTARATTPYRPDLDTTPNLKRLATLGMKVEQAYSVVPHTSKSLVTSLCGTWPQLKTGVDEAKIGGLPQRCLPEILTEQGYRTAFFQTAAEDFEDRYALVHNLGFDFFRARDTLRRPPYSDVNYFGLEDEAMVGPGIEWSAAEPGPFFATYLTLTTHHDYSTPASWEQRKYPGFIPRQVTYLNAVRYVDDVVGKLIAAYEARGLADNTLFVLFGDHGEAFSEHGRSMHDLVIWDEGLHIPMVLYGPNIVGVGQTITGERQQIDLVPTILDVLGLRAEGGSLPGSSLLGPAPDRALYHSCWRSHRCQAIRQDGTKTIDHFLDGPMQQFDIRTDPLERADLLKGQKTPATEALSDQMRDWRARVNGRYEAVLDAELARRQTPDASPAVATWAGKMDLLGCTIQNTTVIPAERIWLHCRWRAREHIRQAWRVDVSVEGAFPSTSTNEHPMDGLLPTFKWTAGTAVDDVVYVRVPAGAPPGPATVYVGWERYGDGVIDLDGGGTRYAVGTVEIGAPIAPFDGADEAPSAVVPDQDPGE